MGAGFNNTVYAIKRHNGVTYAAGSFTSSNGAALYHIARWNESTDVWEALGTGTNNAVYTLESYGGYLYAGGAFTTAGGVSTGGLAKWDGTSWSRVGGITFTGTVYALEVHLSGFLIVGGSFSVIAGSPNIAWYDGTNFSPISSGTNGAVRSLLSKGTEIYVGGDFTAVGVALPASRVAIWGGGWSPVAGGADQSVLALALSHDEVHAGGTFTTVSNGGVSSKGWARYLLTGVPWLVSQPYGQSVASGATVSFTSQPAMGYSGITEQWYRNGAAIENGPTANGPSVSEGTLSTISGANSSTLTIANISIEDAGKYWFVVGNASGSVTSAIVTLVVDGVADVQPSAPTMATVFESLGPNPSTGPAQLAFSLVRDADVQVRVHDLAGRLVSAMEGGRLAAGHHHLSWDGRGNEGLPVRSGLFFVTLEVDGRRVGARRLVVQR